MINSFDSTIFHFLYSFAELNRALDLFIIFLGSILPYLVGLAVIILPYLLLESSDRRSISKGEAIIYAFISGIIARFAITPLIRFYFPRERPFTLLHLTPLIANETGSGFPSGHAVFFFALAASVWFFDRKFGYLLGVLALVIGLARIAAGVHWPTDVIVGAVVGVLVSFAIEFLRRKFSKKS